MYLDKAYYVKFLSKTGKYSKVNLEKLSYEELVKLFNSFMYQSRKLGRL